MQTEEMRIACLRKMLPIKADGSKEHYDLIEHAGSYDELKQRIPLLDVIGAERACSGCLIPLISNLQLLAERGTELKKALAVCVGKRPEVPEDKDCLLVGDCARVDGREDLDWVSGCPPDRADLLDHLVKAMVGQAGQR